MNLDRNTTAVLALHWINDIVSEGGAFGGRFAGEVARTGTAGHARRVLTAARQTGVPVFYTRIVYQPGYPGLIVNAPLFEGIRPAGAFLAGGGGVEILPELAPEEGDTVLDTGRVSAFTGTGLHEVLRGQGIETVVLTGVSTHITVQSSALAAVDLGYRVVIASDATSADSAATHEHALRALAVLCDVATSSEIVDALLDSPAGTAHEVRTP
ncbi:nicotinamidase-related amidase [Pseudonocardia eucalypti]|nr:nicotinamidase-related amidase [Pseudonocardia eucalypti]